MFRPGLVAVGLSLVAACKFSTATFGSPTAGGPGGQAGNATVPTVFLLQRDAALAAIKQAGFTGEVTFDSSLCGSAVDGQIVESGAVCYQQPAAGQVMGTGLPIVLRVQTEDPRHGKVGQFGEWHLMPNMKGMSLTAAQQAMHAAGFTDENTQVGEVDEPGCAPRVVCRSFPDALSRAVQSSGRVLFVGRDPNAKVAPATAPAKAPPEPGDKPAEPNKPKPDDTSGSETYF
jgi:beta-lactam-binding protein with PASTA domain